MAFGVVLGLLHNFLWLAYADFDGCRMSLLGDHLCDDSVLSVSPNDDEMLNAIECP
ncbi:hypothetical protein EWM64_g4656 [Hericium alpestre]|uniref:Uncharacterized protein n=1 Tax=Hericium alpestre TaxID=135208 RepID=A0A4Y9ZYS4_9AGAM|nr:hypothetical protein EWM64_g4656 [Hericium alpestre]